uniref:Uncharacterized protein n=1 Tax=Oryza brachyantha TaxID=4533 RepID=J3L1H4_ORYBR
MEGMEGARDIAATPRSFSSLQGEAGSLGSWKGVEMEGRNAWRRFGHTHAPPLWIRVCGASVPLPLPARPSRHPSSLSLSLSLSTPRRQRLWRLPLLAGAAELIARWRAGLRFVRFAGTRHGRSTFRHSAPCDCPCQPRVHLSFAYTRRQEQWCVRVKFILANTVIIQIALGE